MILHCKNIICKIFSHFIIVLMSVLFLFSCNKVSNTQNNDNNSDFDTVISDNVKYVVSYKYASLDDQCKNLENQKSEINENSQIDRNEYIYSGNPMLDKLTRSSENATYCCKSPSNKHIYEYANEFLKKGYLSDKNVSFVVLMGFQRNCRNLL